jgi:hypothetical protein
VLFSKVANAEVNQTWCVGLIQVVRGLSKEFFVNMKTDELVTVTDLLDIEIVPSLVDGLFFSFGERASGAAPAASSLENLESVLAVYLSFVPSTIPNATTHPSEYPDA